MKSFERFLGRSLVAMTTAAAVALALGRPSAALAAPQAPDIVAEGTPLLSELNDPKYQHSRCMLPPVLSADGRAVVRSPDAAFVPGDTFIAVDGDVLEAGSRTALIDILERRAPDAHVAIRLSGKGGERVVAAQCADSKPYYDELREAARAAVVRDAAECVRRSESAAGMHGLASVWLRLAMSCKIAAGRLAGAAMWKADYELFRQRIEEARSDPPLLKSLRHPVLGAARDLSDHGYRQLSDDLRRDYATAFASLGETIGDED